MGYHLAKIYYIDWPWTVRKKNQKIHTQWKNPENKNHLMGPNDYDI